MRTYTFDAGSAAIEATLDLIGDRWRIVRLTYDDKRGLETTTLRKWPVAKIEAMASAPPDEDLAGSDFVVTIPRKPYPDEFYRRIAWLYRAASPRMHNPGAVIAKANNVPPTTAHGWIRECRRRGYLDRGRVGTAG